MREYILNVISVFSPSEESEDWIKELQQVVQEYEVVSDTDKMKDENWDKEIEELLQDN